MYSREHPPARFWGQYEDPILCETTKYTVDLFSKHSLLYLASASIVKCPCFVLQGTLFKALEHYALLLLSPFPHLSASATIIMHNGLQFYINIQYNRA